MPDARSPGALIELKSVPNLRDLGGWPVAGGGHVRRGQLYRSTQLDKLDGEDAVTFCELGIKTVYDLRTDAERSSRPDHLPDGVEGVSVNVFGKREEPASAKWKKALGILGDVLGDASSASPAELLEVLGSPKERGSAATAERAAEVFKTGYRQIVSHPSALEAYRTMFAGFASASRRPALFHCTTGKDRTGWGAAAILSYLGVSRQDVMADYLITNRDLLPAVQPVFDRMARHGIDAQMMNPVFGVREEYLETAFAEMTEQFGTIEGYFEQGLGLGSDVLADLRTQLVERG